jgi:Protein of unknown function (DUF2946)
MDRARPASGWRASAMAVALLAVTLNFLQPLVHAALMRDGAPTALWSVFCSAAAATDPGAHGSAPPLTGKAHECCLGMAHAATALTPPTAFVDVESTATAQAPPLPAERRTSCDAARRVASVFSRGKFPCCRFERQ